MGLKIGRRSIIFLYFLFAIGYSVLMPMWEAPDEPAHYQLALSFARTGQRPPLEENYEARQPPLYYWLASNPIKILDRIDPTYVDFYAPLQRPWRSVPFYDWNADNYRLSVGPMVLRILNVLLGCVSIYIMVLASRIILPDIPEITLSTVSFAAMLPQFLHNTSTVNNDALSILAGTFLFYLLSRFCTGISSSYEKTLLVLLAFLLPVTIKLTLVPISITALLLVIWHDRKNVRVWLLLGAAILIILFMASQESFPLGRVIQRILFDIHPDVAQRPLWQMMGLFAWSFWGKLGWLNLEAVGLPIALIVLITLLTISGAALNFWQTFLKKSNCTGDISSQRMDYSSEPEYRNCRSMLWLAATLALICAARFALAEHQFQGRFLFPTITPIALIVVSGWQGIIPQKVTAYLPHLTLTIMILLNLYLWFFKIIPTFYQPLLG